MISPTTIEAVCPNCGHAFDRDLVEGDFRDTSQLSTKDAAEGLLFYYTGDASSAGIADSLKADLENLLVEKYGVSKGKI